jgi:hypothetical protein
MVVMLRNKVQMVHEPHGLPKTRMQHGAGKETRLKFLNAIHPAASDPCFFAVNQMADDRAT